MLALTGCHKQPPATEAQKKPAPPAEPIKAEVADVSLQVWPTVVRCQGSLMADDQTVLGSRVAGLVHDTLVDVGDRVQPGQTLVTLDDSEFKLQLAAAEAAVLQARALIGLKPADPVSKLDPLNAPPVREARATWEETRGRRERWEKLREQNAVTEEELQTLIAAEKVAEARYASAMNGVNSNIAQVAVRSAEVELAKQRIRDAQITAPFAGSVQQRQVAAGTFVQIGMPLLTLVRLDALRFRGTVPERLATNIQLGQRVQLTIESVDGPVDAKVTRINPALDMASRSLSFEALIDNSDGKLRPGLFAEAEVTIDPDSQSVVIPESALVEFAGAQKIWKLVDGSAKEQIVIPGRRSSRMVEIVDGLKPGEQFLVNGSIGRVAKVLPPDSPTAPSALAASADPTGSPGPAATTPVATTPPDVASTTPAEAVANDAREQVAPLADGAGEKVPQGDTPGLKKSLETVPASAAKSQSQPVVPAPNKTIKAEATDPLNAG
ncbi:MAG: efflux RND transporter periplasmic adaptor subunit [Pirellulaceae bacterium]|nr:efflux RND transporter periplasmic adaptor subunit [Pirellulaceae bacterium]